MNAELRKRLEEAAEKQLNCATCLARKYGECKESKCLPYRSFLTGVEQGYKEAVEQAKKWLKDSCERVGFTGMTINQTADTFETDMNKLWEEKK